MKFAQLKAEEVIALNELKFEKEDGVIFRLSEKERELLILTFRIRTRNDLVELRNAVVKFIFDLMKICREQDECEECEECDRLHKVQIVMTSIIDNEIKERELQEI